MKKILIVFAAGALLASCGNQDVEAAAEYCDCYNLAAGAEADAANAESATDMMENIIEATKKTNECVTAWQTKYEGKITKEGLAAEMEKKCPEAYKQAKEGGMFDE